jgi:Cdc6-like AAA superfamily ATPase
LQWLWGHEKYQAWSSTDTSNLLLIEGKPGSGKSTLTKYFKRNILKRELLAKQSIVASFFYSYREGEVQKDHSNMLRSILYDVLRQNETFFFHFQTLYRKTLPSGVWPYDSLRKILLSFKMHPAKERLYLIVDAVDESDDDDRHDIIELLC